MWKTTLSSVSHAALVSPGGGQRGRCLERKERNEEKETVVVVVLDAIDRGQKLARIPKTERISTSFCVSTENSVDLTFRAKLRRTLTRVKTAQCCGTQKILSQGRRTHIYLEGSP